MRERALLLNLVAELRGRLDELEHLVRTAPNHAIMSPVSLDGDDLVDLTPRAYAAFRSRGLDAPRRIKRYEPFPAFVQFGTPEVDGVVEVSAFELSDLHRIGPEPAFGLRLVPLSTEAQAWFAFDLLLTIPNAPDYAWMEWILKLSFDQPLNSFLQFIIEGDGFSERVDVGVTAIGEFAEFMHVRLFRDQILQAAAGREVQKIRLTLATGGMPMPLTIYGLSIFAKN
jgi:hypothetical protein